MYFFNAYSMLIPSNRLYERAVETISILRAKGFDALLAGGYVRDMLLGIEPQDYDIATNALPDQVLDAFPYAIMTWSRLGVVILPVRGSRFEITSFRGEGQYLDGRRPSSVRFTDAREDAKRRDFTINGMFYDPLKDEIIDYVNGQEDLKAGIVRAIGNPYERFGEDHLRIIRAIRFAARFGFEIEAETYNAIRGFVHLINKISVERIQQELTKILVSSNADIAFEMMLDTAILKEILPEVALMKGVDQPIEFHPEGDVWEHTILMLREMRTDNSALAWGVLLHDIGKPATYELRDRIRFNEHDKVGVKIATGILERLRLPNHDRDVILSLIDKHMKFMSVQKMRMSTLKRFLRQDDFPLHLELHRLDCIASHAKLDNYHFCKDKLAGLEEEPQMLKPKALINGDDLISLGFKPGALFKDILNAVEDEQLEGRIASKEEALSFVLERYKEHRDDNL